MSDAAALGTEESRVGAISLPDAHTLEPAARSGRLPFHTVVLGASAGGVEAIMQFFASMPAQAGCAFLVVMHLSPDRESMLATLIGRTTQMPVVQAEQDARLERNAVYIAPPGQYIELKSGQIELRPIGHRGPKATGIDHCMISVAADQGDRAIGVVLTGFDSDGSVGIKAVKAEGGLTIAQLPSQAAHPDMPRSALATGLVDLELAVEGMAEAIVDYVSADAWRLVPADATRGPGNEADLRAVLDIVRAQLGLDFRGYKTAMLFRRVARRMSLARTASMTDFATLLQADAAETRALANDFLQRHGVLSRA